MKKKRSISDLKGEFLHISSIKKQYGIISNLLSSDKQLSGGSHKIYHISNFFNKNKQNCKECKFKINKNIISSVNLQIGGHSIPQKNLIETRDLCYTGTRVKLVNPNIVSYGGKQVKHYYKTIVRRCAKHENDIKHKL